MRYAIYSEVQEAGTQFAYKFKNFCNTQTVIFPYITKYEIKTVTIKTVRPVTANLKNVLNDKYGKKSCFRNH